MVEKSGFSKWSNSTKNGRKKKVWFRAAPPSADFIGASDGVVAAAPRDR